MPQTLTPAQRAERMSNGEIAALIASHDDALAALHDWAVWHYQRFGSQQPAAGAPLAETTRLLVASASKV